MSEFSENWKQVGKYTVFENHPKCRIWIFKFGIFHQFLSD